MLKLYFARPAAYARPVWLSLLEKGLVFELVPVDLGGEQFGDAFQAINPFGYVPVLVDDGFRVVECLAILDYLEARYPQQPLMPEDAVAIAKVRMVQSISFSALLPAFFKMVAYPKDPAETAYGRQRKMNALNFLEELLGEKTFFAGERLTMAEIVAGTLVYRVDALGLPLANYPQLTAWSKRLLLRPTWQEIELSVREWIRFKRKMQVLPRLWNRQRRMRMGLLTDNRS